MVLLAPSLNSDASSGIDQSSEMGDGDRRVSGSTFKISSMLPRSWSQLVPVGTVTDVLHQLAAQDECILDVLGLAVKGVLEPLARLKDDSFGRLRIA